MVGVATGPIALALGLLLLAFICAVSINLLRGRRIECGCAGAAAREITWSHVLRNLAFTVMAVIVTVRPVDALSLWSGWQVGKQAPMPDGQAIAILLDTSAAVAGFVLANSAVRTLRMAGVLGGVSGALGPPAGSIGAEDR